MVKYKFILIFTLLLATTLVQAQVTIGSDKNPLRGALLMLNDGTIDNTNASVNATGGLGLPRVELTNLKPQTPADFSQSIGGSGDWDMDQHIGMMVYNAKGEVCDPPVGLYVWSGRQWQGIAIKKDVSPEVKYYRDERDPTDVVEYPYRNFGAEAGDWMLMNMRATKFDTNIVGVTFDPSENPQSGAISVDKPRWGYPNINDASPADATVFNLDKRVGFLYNWAAATGKQNLSTVDQGEGREGVVNPNPGDVQQVGVQGICPNGWHVPSDKEWNILAKELCENPDEYTNGGVSEPWNNEWNYSSAVPWTEGTHGQNMKYPCPVPFSSYDPNGKSLSAEDGGFSLLLVGRGDAQSTIYGSSGYLWSSSYAGPTGGGNLAWCRLFSSSRNSIFRNHHSKSFLSSVRCKKD